MQEKPFDCMEGEKKYRDDANELYYSEESLKYGYVPQEICAARVSAGAFECVPSSQPPSGHQWTANIEK